LIERRKRGWQAAF